MYLVSSLNQGLSPNSAANIASRKPVTAIQTMRGASQSLSAFFFSGVKKRGVFVLDTGALIGNHPFQTHTQVSESSMLPRGERNCSDLDHCPGASVLRAAY